MTHPLRILLLLILVSSSCKAEQQSPGRVTPTFPTPPETLTEPESRASYVVTEVWTPCSEVDTLDFASASEREQFIVDYLALGGIASEDAFRSSISKAFEIGTEPFSQELKQLAIRYLSHRRSPLYNMDQYIYVMDAALEYGLLDEAEEIRYHEERTLWSKNRVGALSKDFAYVTPSGVEQTLHTTPVTKSLLVAFYAPDCSICSSIFAYIEQSSPLQEALEQGDLSLLCIDPYGEERSFQRSLSEVPHGAIVGLDSERIVLEQSLYDLRSVPTLYLLDEEYRVQMKNLEIDQLEQMFRERYGM
ncbi:MAG: DUF5106 domain-containing protein [Porphyromonas sp.]|nr:DUF5106 domain-containing protein [Porphyromonas sp.]